MLMPDCRSPINPIRELSVIIKSELPIAIFISRPASKTNPSWNVFEIKYKYLEDLSDLKNYMRSALRQQFQI